MSTIKDIWIRRVSGTDEIRTSKEVDFLHVLTAAGITGIWGPIASIQSSLILSCLREQLINLSVEQASQAVAIAAESRHATGWFAMACAACDLALWDVLGKEASVPVFSLLGETGIKRDRIPCYASLLGYDLFDLPDREQLVALTEQFWGLKFAVRLGPRDGTRGIRRTLDALTALPLSGSKRLMIDALCGWTLEHTIAFLAESNGLGLTWIEEPFPARDLVAYRSVAHRSLTPIAAGEHAYSLDDFCNLIESNVRILQPDAGWCSGLETFSAVIGKAEEAHCQVFPHGGGLLPALHLALHHSENTLPAIEYHLTIEPLRQRFWLHKFVPANGALAAPSGPGMGIELDEDAIVRSSDIRGIRWASH